MKDDVGAQIERLRLKFRAKSDVELAGKLNVDKSTISSWRSRNRVPEKYLELLKLDLRNFFISPPSKWGELEKAALGLALFRVSLATKEVIEAADYHETMKTFHLSGTFWLIFSKALKDILRRQEDGGYPLESAQAMKFFDDLQEPERIASMVLDDFVIPSFRGEKK